MTSEEAKISLSFHSGRNTDIKNPRWINGFWGSLRKFNGDIIEENFIDEFACRYIWDIIPNNSLDPRRRTTV